MCILVGLPWIVAFVELCIGNIELVGVQDIMRIVLELQGIIPGLQKIGTGGTVMILMVVVVGSHIVLRELQFDLLSSTRLQKLGFGEGAQFSGRLLHMIAPVIVGVGSCVVQLDGILASYLASVLYFDGGLHLPAGHPNILELPVKRGVAQPVAERIGHSTRLGDATVLIQPAVDEIRIFDTGRLIIAVADVYALFIFDIRAIDGAAVGSRHEITQDRLILDLSVGVMVFTKIGKGRILGEIGWISVCQATGRINLSAQYPAK